MTTLLEQVTMPCSKCQGRDFRFYSAREFATKPEGARMVAEAVEHARVAVGEVLSGAARVCLVCGSFGLWF